MHLFNAASCCARAGDFHTAIGRGDHLQAKVGLPPRLCQRAQEFTDAIRNRCSQWAAEPVLTTDGD